MTDERLKPGNCHKCGLPMSDNPHSEAGKPAYYLDVGCPRECIPCLVHSRHQWASRAMRAESEVLDLLAARATAEQRDSVIEECAKVAEAHADGTGYASDCTAAIRALKSQQDAAIESKQAEQPDPIRALIAVHAEQLDQNDHAYFELAYTRHTAWMAWLCSNSRDDDPNRKVLAKGQGHTPEEACAAAVEAQRSGDGSNADQT